jgi:hypothetical protein
MIFKIKKSYINNKKMTKIMIKIIKMTKIQVVIMIKIMINLQKDAFNDLFGVNCLLLKIQS